jgi:Replication-relaxation
LANLVGHRPNPRRCGRRVNRLATSPKLPHVLGVNLFFVDLAGHAYIAEGVELSVWWSERTCRG